MFSGICRDIFTLFQRNEKSNLVYLPGKDYPSESSSVPQHESSQEDAEYVSMRDESDESL
jgi:hypothetical protein